MSYSKKLVTVKSAWKSKINWTQAFALAASVLAIWGIDLDGETQAALVVTIQGASAVVTWVLRTFFTTQITSGSV